MLTQRVVAMLILSGGLQEVLLSNAVQEMEDRWPSGVALRGEAANHPMLRWPKTVVVNDWEKAHQMRQVGTGKTFRKRRKLRRRC